MDLCHTLKLILCPDISFYIRPNINFIHNMYHAIYYCCNSLVSSFVLRITIFHTKHMKFLLNKNSYEYAKYLASETCNNSILYAKDFEISSLWNFTRDAKCSRNQTLFRIVCILQNNYRGFVKIPSYDG